MSDSIRKLFVRTSGIDSEIRLPADATTEKVVQRLYVLLGYIPKLEDIRILDEHDVYYGSIQPKAKLMDYIPNDYWTLEVVGGKSSLFDVEEESARYQMDMEKYKQLPTNAQKFLKNIKKVNKNQTGNPGWIPLS